MRSLRWQCLSYQKDERSRPGKSSNNAMFFLPPKKASLTIPSLLTFFYSFNYYFLWQFLSLSFFLSGKSFPNPRLALKYW